MLVSFLLPLVALGLMLSAVLGALVNVVVAFDFASRSHGGRGAGSRLRLAFMGAYVAPLMGAVVPVVTASVFAGGRVGALVLVVSIIASVLGLHVADDPTRVKAAIAAAVIASAAAVYVGTVGHTMHWPMSTSWTFRGAAALAFLAYPITCGLSCVALVTLAFAAPSDRIAIAAVRSRTQRWLGLVVLFQVLGYLFVNVPRWGDWFHSDIRPY